MPFLNLDVIDSWQMIQICQSSSQYSLWSAGQLVSSLISLLIVRVNSALLLHPDLKRPGSVGQWVTDTAMCESLWLWCPACPFFATFISPLLGHWRCFCQVYWMRVPGAQSESQTAVQNARVNVKSIKTDPLVDYLWGAIDASMHLKFATAMNLTVRQVAVPADVWTREQQAQNNFRGPTF